MKTFYKYHGLGNDYIYFDCFEERVSAPYNAAKVLSDRHFSIGGDGVVLILPSDVADARMRMFNADGSEGMMCGNAIRCVGKYLYDVKGIRKKSLTIETKSGVKTLIVHTKRHTGESYAFTVNMGKPVFKPSRIPALFEGDKAVNVPLLVGEDSYRVTLVSMGNPHCVVFDHGETDVQKVGPLFEHHPAFPDRVNTEFVRVLGDGSLSVRVWERGSGETLACGTGACAAAVAAVLNGYAKTGEIILVRLKGGVLKVVYTGKTVLLTGPAEFAFKGEVDV